MFARLILMILSFVVVQTLGEATAFAGTSSVGGGANGINGKPLDSYIKDPRDTEAFKTYLKPIFDHIDAAAVEGLKPEERKHATSFSSYLGSKTWYFVPAELTTIANDALGVSFNGSETQQIAHHKKTSIWINTLIFDKMSLEDQATTIMHEFVMTMYFMKFKSISELCIDAANSGGECSMSPRDMKLADQMYPSEPLRALNADDYENIRPVTSWLMRAGVSSSYDSILTMFLSHHFDRRFFNLHQTHKEEIKFSDKDMLSALRRAKYGRLLPTKCLGADGSNLGSCSVDLDETMIPYPGLPGATMPGVHLVVKNAAGVIADLNLMISSETTLEPTIDPQTGAKFSIAVPINLVDANSAQPGQVVKNVMLFMRHSGTSEKPVIEVDSMAILPVVLAEIDLTKDNPCTPMSLEEDDIHERALILVAKKSELSPFFRTMIGFFPPLAICSKH